MCALGKARAGPMPSGLVGCASGRGLDSQRPANVALPSGTKVSRVRVPVGSVALSTNNAGAPVIEQSENEIGSKPQLAFCHPVVYRSSHLPSLPR